MDFWSSEAIAECARIAVIMHTTQEKSQFCTSGLNILPVVVLFDGRASSFQPPIMASKVMLLA